jgi:hypothetical protein
MTALGLSMLLNALIFALIGGLSVQSKLFQKPAQITPKPEPPSENVLTIFPQIAPDNSPQPPPLKKRFARTSEDQSAATPEKPSFIGERDTQATSDRTPAPNAPALPSQKGAPPKNSDDLETTASDYQDGKIASPTTDSQTAATASTAESDPTPAEQLDSGALTETPAAAAATASPPPRERLLDGPNPVDLPVPLTPPTPDPIKETAAQPPRGAPTTVKPIAPAETPPSAPKIPNKDPNFSGFQRKAAIQGSISRTGRSALNVANTPLGHYQAVISRAVEQEWQRNCVRHRDFITPGFLTVRFFVETTGRVRTVQFVGDMETGEVQKGFTLNSIRDAEIPAMPQALRKEYANEPLELIFNFYF